MQCDWLRIGCSRRKLGKSRLRNTCLCGRLWYTTDKIFQYSRVIYYLNTTPVIMLVILRLRSFLISLNRSLLGLVVKILRESEALHVPRKRGLKRPQLTKLQTKIVYGTPHQPIASKPVKKYLDPLLLRVVPPVDHSLVLAV